MPIDPITLTIIASVVGILTFIYMVFFGQRSIADLIAKWRESRKIGDEEKDLAQAELEFLQEEYSKVSRRLEELQAAPDLDRRLRADALLLLGPALAYSGELDKAMQHSSESLFLLEELRDAEKLSDEEITKIGIAFNNMGFVFRLHGEWDKAVLYYKKSLEISRAEKERADVLNNMGNVYRLSGEFDTALTYCKHSLMIRTRINIPHDVGLSLNTLGMIYRDMGYIRQTMRFFKKALEIFEEIDSLRGKGLVYVNLGNMYRLVEDYEKAFRFLDKTAKMFEKSSDEVSLAETLNELGCAYRDQGRYQEAEDNLSRSLELATENTDWFRIANGLEDLSATFYRSGDLEKAEERAKKAKDLAEQHNYRFLQSKCLRNLGNIAFAKDLFQEAFSYYAEACLTATRYSFSSYWRILDWMESQLLQLAELPRSETCHYLMGFWQMMGMDREYPEFITKCEFAMKGW